VALDPEIRQGFATNLLVGVEDLPDGMKLDDYERATRMQINALGDPEGKIEVGEAALPAGEAPRCPTGRRSPSGARKASSRRGTTTSWTRDKGYVITLTTLPSLLDACADSFVRSADTFISR
jgi:hypothetical protein